MKKFFSFAALCFAVICLTGCAHNTRGIAIGTGVNLGFDPNTGKAGIQYVDGLSLIDCSRENSYVRVAVDSESGVSKDANGSIKGVKNIETGIGPQLNGYLVDIAKDDPEMAKAYINAVGEYWKFRTAELNSSK